MAFHRRGRRCHGDCKLVVRVVGRVRGASAPTRWVRCRKQGPSTKRPLGPTRFARTPDGGPPSRRLSRRAMHYPQVRDDTDHRAGEGGGASAGLKSAWGKHTQPGSPEAVAVPAPTGAAGGSPRREPWGEAAVLAASPGGAKEGSAGREPGAETANGLPPLQGSTSSWGAASRWLAPSATICRPLRGLDDSRA
jgi:hypothetical protein